MTSNVTPFMPPAPPGPYKYPQRSAFRGNGTLMLDTANLIVQANKVEAGRVEAQRVSIMGDPNTNVPPLTTLGISTPYMYSHYLDASNVDQFRATIAISNDFVQLVSNTIISGSLLVGDLATPPIIPTWSVISKGSLVLGNGTLADALGVNGGQVVGRCPLYCDGPRPPLVTKGSVLDLDGGFIYGSALVYT